MSLRIDRQRCTLCGNCIKCCPYEALQISEGTLTVDERCVLCAACIEVCPEDALSIEEKSRARRPTPPGRDAYCGVWIFGEQHEGKLHPVVFELVGIGARLAQQRNCGLEVVVLGDGLLGIPEQLAGHSVGTVYLVESPDLAAYTAEAYAQALAEVARRHKPEIILAGATSTGRSLMPRLAILLETGLTADCTALAIDEESGNLLQTRPAFGGNIMATILCPRHRPQMATVRPKVMKPAEPEGRRMPVAKRLHPRLERVAAQVEVLGIRREEEGGVDIAEADVLVAGGRGIGGPAGFRILRELADELGGQLAASRVAVDSGWISYPHQVGQTGRTVQPKLYIACGISGSVQHRVGMQSAGTIVAINVDPHAPIFEIADYGIVGDFASVVPRIIQDVGKLKKESRDEHE